MERHMVNFLRIVLVSVCLLGSSALYAAESDTNETTSVSQTPSQSEAVSTTADPLESFNRFSHSFNHQLDITIFKPVAAIYRILVPPFLRKGVTHFFSNVGEVPTVINGVLQGKIGQATSDVGRLLLNTTVGVGGLFDFATPIGLEKHHEDFGLTLARWGWKDSFYLELPILGPSTIRDAVGFVPNYFTTVWPYTFYYAPAYVSYPAFALDIINKRSNLLKADKIIQTTSLDRYVTIRDAYLQKRSSAINPQVDDLLADDTGLSDDDPYVEE